MNGIYLLIFIIFSINSVVSDAKAFHIRLNEIAMGIVITLATRWFMQTTEWLDITLGIAFGAGTFALLHLLSRNRLGAGDVWFSTFMGATLGFWSWDAAVAIGTFLALLWLIVLRIFSFITSFHNYRIPLVPFLFLGSIIVFKYKGL